ncbi:MAG: four helix bundle protein [Bacteroidota bacterium]|nr:four helix bundle protein [Bacteroidota bacterium]
MNEEVETLISRTKKFALRIIKLYSSLPKTVPAQVIGKQLLRSGTSVGANYREAYRSRSKQEFTSTLGICLKELEETSYWLDLLVESGITPKEKLEQLIDECNQLISIFVTIIKKRKIS